jgi:glycosyltransferase involved in cell wall biosynthesis
VCKFFRFRELAYHSFIPSKKLYLEGFWIKKNAGISIIIPVYNENQKLKQAVEGTMAKLKTLDCASEIIIAEDGSTDGTYDSASKLASENSDIRLIHSDRRQGRGQALGRAIKAAKGEVVCYIDVDLATDMSYLPLLIAAVLTEGYDFATGSRLMPQSDAKRSPKRLIASKSFNWMVRVLLASRLHDHQCGFKAFRRASVLQLLDEVKDKHWFWDTEILVRGQIHGFRIKEIPVKWNESVSTKVNILKDANDMGRQIFRLWWDLKGNGR